MTPTRERRHDPCGREGRGSGQIAQFSYLEPSAGTRRVAFATPILRDRSRQCDLFPTGRSLPDTSKTMAV